MVKCENSYWERTWSTWVCSAHSTKRFHITWLVYKGTCAANHGFIREISGVFPPEFRCHAWASWEIPYEGLVGKKTSNKHWGLLFDYQKVVDDRGTWNLGIPTKITKHSFLIHLTFQNADDIDSSRSRRITYIQYTVYIYMVLNSCSIYLLHFCVYKYGTKKPNPPRCWFMIHKKTQLFGYLVSWDPLSCVKYVELRQNCHEKYIEIIVQHDGVVCELRSKLIWIPSGTRIISHALLAISHFKFDGNVGDTISSD